MNKVKGLLTRSQEWEQKVKSALKQKPPHPAMFFETMLSKSKEIPVQLPSINTITESLMKAEDWSKQAQAMQVGVTLCCSSCCFFHPVPLFRVFLHQ